MSDDADYIPDDEDDEETHTDKHIQTNRKSEVAMQYLPIHTRLRFLSGSVNPVYRCRALLAHPGLNHVAPGPP